MISNCDHSIAGWNITGDAAVIRDVVRFSEELLPKYFRHSNYRSFARQLNFYQFVTQSVAVADDGRRHGPPREPEKRFANPNFRRDRPDLLYRIRRVDNSPSRRNRKKAKETKKNFDGSHDLVIDSESDSDVPVGADKNEDDESYETIKQHNEQQTVDPVVEKVRERVTRKPFSISLDCNDAKGNEDGRDDDDDDCDDDWFNLDETMARSGGITTTECEYCPSDCSPLLTLSTVATAFLQAERSS